jgi:hypothetical protein
VLHGFVDLHGGRPLHSRLAVLVDGRGSRALGRRRGKERVVCSKHNAILSNEFDKAVHGGLAVRYGIEVETLEVVSGSVLETIGDCDIMCDTTIKTPHERGHGGTGMCDQEAELGESVKSAADNEAGHSHGGFEGESCGESVKITCTERDEE